MQDPAPAAPSRRPPLTAVHPITGYKSSSIEQAVAGYNRDAQALTDQITAGVHSAVWEDHKRGYPHIRIGDEGYDLNAALDEVYQAGVASAQELLHLTQGAASKAVQAAIGKQLLHEIGRVAGEAHPESVHTTLEDMAVSYGVPRMQVQATRTRVLGNIVWI